MIKVFKKTFEKIDNVKNFYKDVLYRIQKEKKIFFRIVHIDENHIELQVKGKTASLKKTKVVDVIYEHHIISGLSSRDACTLGVYYGYNLKKIGRENCSINYPLLCINNEGRYRLVNEDRDGNIGYMDTKTNEIFLNSPIYIANNAMIIDQFDPTQACYIGILAGYRSYRLEETSKKSTYNNNVVSLFDYKQSANSKK